MKIRLQNYYNQAISLAFISGLLLVLGNAQAQVLEEVIVTAQKREQGIQDVGIAITAFSGDQLRDLGISTPDELDMHVPGLMVTDFGNSYISVFTLRGSSQLDFADHQEPPVAVYLDGAYVSFIGGVGMAFYDLERAEVLKGPQGTLFGRNATGGLVHLITKKPSQEANGYLEVSGGEYGMVKTEGGIGMPLGKNLSGRISGLWNKHNGYIDNLTDTDEDLVEMDSRNLRGQLLWEPDEDTSFLLQGRWSDDKDSNTLGYFARPVALHFPQLSGADLAAGTNGISELLGIPNDPSVIFPPIGQGDGLVRLSDPDSAEYANFCSHPLSVGFFGGPGAVDCFGNVEDGDPRTARVNQFGSFTREYWGLTGTLNMNFGNFEVVNILDYQSFDKYYIEDTDGTPITSLDFFQYVDSWQFSEEFRVHWETDRSRWVAGAYYLHIEGDYRSGVYTPEGLGFGMDNNYSNETDSYAFFIQGEYDVSPAWTVIGGFRWTEDEKNTVLSPTCEWNIVGDPDCSFVLLPFLGFAGNSAQEQGFDLERSEGDYSLKFEIDWKPNDDWLVYAGVTRGNKAGAFNSGALALYTIPQAEFDGETLWSYEAGFKSTLLNGTTRLNATAFYYDYSDFQTYTQVGPSLVVFNIDSEVVGAEIELVTNPWEGWEFLFGVSILDAQIKDLNYGAGLQSDVEMTNSPELSLNGLGRYTWNAFAGGSMTAQLDFNYVDERQLNAVPSPAYIADDYFLLNARLGYMTGDGRWSAALWVKNLTDEEWVPTVFDLGTFTGSSIETVGAPRWFGGTVSYHWN